MPPAGRVHEVGTWVKDTNQQDECMAGRPVTRAKANESWFSCLFSLSVISGAGGK